MLSTPLGEAAYALCVHIQSSGFEALMVGGSVRNCILGLPVDDIDIATNALPEQIEQMCTVIPSHGVERTASHRVKFYGKVFEVTTYRTEYYTPGNRIPQKIEFTTRKNDALRRDFTINALYADIVSGTVYDDVGGLIDLHERVVRFIGTPNDRIMQDPLRILRAIRLRNTIYGQYEPNTYHAIQIQSECIASVSPATLWKEFEKIIKLPNADNALEDAWELSALKHLLPELYCLKGIAQPREYHAEGDVWQHTLLAVRNSPECDIATKFAILFHDIGKANTYSIHNDRIHFNEHATASKAIVSLIGKRFLLSTSVISKLEFLVAHHMMIGNLLEMTEHRKAHWYFHRWFNDLLIVFYADIAGTIPADFSLYNAVYADYCAFIDAHPKRLQSLLNGKEIMQILQIKPSAQVEDVKRQIEEHMINGSITTKAQAVDFVSTLKNKL